MEHEAEIRDIGVAVDEEGGGTPVVLLGARGSVIPIFIGPGQAQSMEFARRDVPSERPLTHDLLIDMLTEFGGSIDQVRIDDLSEGTFYAKIDVDHYDDGVRDKFVFDARPSDGIALALRVECPIFVSDDVIDAAGQPPDEFAPEDDPEFEFED